jgi:hypothetical protein
LNSLDILSLLFQQQFWKALTNGNTRVVAHTYIQGTFLEMALPELAAVSGWNWKWAVHMASKRGFKTVWRWFPRPFHPREDEEDRNERNGLLKSHLDQVVPVADADEETKALALHVEPKVPEDLDSMLLSSPL